MEYLVVASRLLTALLFEAAQEGDVLVQLLLHIALSFSITIKIQGRKLYTVEISVETAPLTTLLEVQTVARGKFLYLLT